MLSGSYKKIGDYGIIGNGLTLASVGIDGSIDWMCLPYMDSPSVFAAILDHETGGRFAVRPDGPWDSVQNYLPRTNILKTLFRTVSGVVELIDFIPAGPAAEEDPANRTRLLRRIRCIQGNVRLGIEFTPRFDYGRLKPAWSQSDDQRWILRAADQAVSLFASHPLQWQNGCASFDIAAGQTLWLVMGYGAEEHSPDSDFLEQLLMSTEQYWVQWTGAQETGKYPGRGFWQNNLDRAALVLKLLQFRDTGAIAAAATCSLPTIIHGRRNWDYRFSWIRDTSMTLAALFELGHTHEVSLYLEWLKEIARRQDSPELDILYKLREPMPPSGERQLAHLSGYKGSIPVNIGQFNVGQHQHDIYGELLEMIFAVSRLAGKIDPEYWQYVRRMVDHVTMIWRNKDHGIWELRTGPHHVTHSKLNCWVALDRGIKIAQHYGFPADLALWKTQRQHIRQDIVEHGYNPQRRSFTQHYDTDSVDASLLLIPLTGFLPIDDPRVEDTIRAIEKELLIDGVILRYKDDDGLPGREHGFLICFFWYLRCLIRQKRFDEVEGHLRRVERYANHLGLFGEQFDPVYREITGNFPQAFSHIGYATTVLEYLDARRTPSKPRSLPVGKRVGLLFRPALLSPECGEREAPVADPGREVKRIMNILMGQFYDGHRQRINYELVHDSAYYRNFLQAVHTLRHFNPATLQNDRQRIAFWVNVFNALVIHGVIELGIKESVKELPFFFERAQYQIGRHRYTLSDIEHGILRGNATPPYRIRKRFAANDPRLEFRVTLIDPRVHFALVCASRTCPPIEAYDADQLDQQLDDSARVFINATTRIEKEQRIIKISKIFKWYRRDFQTTIAGLTSFIGRYMYDSDIAAWLRQNDTGLTIRYTPYDWRLNR